MSKKDKSTILSLIVLLLVAPQLLFMDWIQKNIPLMDNVFIFLFCLLFLPTIIAALIVRNIPDKKKTAASKKQKKTTVKNNNTNTKLTNNQSHQLRLDEEILELPLEKLSWKEFERLIFLYYASKRGSKARLTSDGKDGGVDLIYYSVYHKANVAVQIKFWNEKNQISVKEIRELNSAKRNHQCILSEFITNTTFSNDALVEADNFNIKTYDRTWVETELIPWKEKQKRKKA